jgi:hypothetical protein
VGLNVGDVYFPEGTPRRRMLLRREIAKGGRAGDVFLPDALIPKLECFWSYKRRSGEGLEAESPLFLQPIRPTHLETTRPDGVQDLATQSWV